jgi:hypothetical protein
MAISNSYRTILCLADGQFSWILWLKRTEGVLRNNRIHWNWVAVWRCTCLKGWSRTSGRNQSAMKQRLDSYCECLLGWSGIWMSIEMTLRVNSLYPPLEMQNGVPFCPKPSYVWVITRMCDKAGGSPASCAKHPAWVAIRREVNKEKAKR